MGTESPSDSQVTRGKRKRTVPRSSTNGEIRIAEKHRNKRVLPSPDMIASAARPAPSMDLPFITSSPRPKSQPTSAAGSPAPSFASRSFPCSSFVLAYTISSQAIKRLSEAQLEIYFRLIGWCACMRFGTLCSHKLAPFRIASPNLAQTATLSLSKSFETVINEAIAVTKSHDVVERHGLTLTHSQTIRLHRTSSRSRTTSLLEDELFSPEPALDELSVSSSASASPSLKSSNGSYFYL